MGYMVGQKGGYDGLGVKKKLYNYFDSQICGQIKEGGCCCFH